MDAERYLTERLEDQIDWHDRKSSHNQRSFKRIQVVIIVASALLPLLAGLQTLPSITPYLIGGIGVLVAVLTGITSLYGFQNLWIEYRVTAESLTREKYRYLARVPPYDGGESLHALVERVESILSEQNSEWQQTVKAESTAEEPA